MAVTSSGGVNGVMGSALGQGSGGRKRKSEDDSLDQSRLDFRFPQEGIGSCLLSVETIALTLPS